LIPHFSSFLSVLLQTQAQRAPSFAITSILLPNDATPCVAMTSCRNYASQSPW
jgi:hypothetical protein